MLERHPLQWLRAVSFALCFAGATFLLPDARADVPPTHGFVDPCSPSNQEDSKTHCEVCSQTGGTFADCAKLKEQGYARGCTRHAGDGEVWCIANDPAGAPVSVMAFAAVFVVASALGGTLFYRKLRARHSG